MSMENITKEEEARFYELCLIALDFARNDEADKLEAMIKAGLNVNLKSAKGDTLLMLASYNNAVNTVKMLLANGAKVDERNDRGQTPLAGAAFKGHLEVVKALVEAGADVRANNGLGATPYTFALMFGRGEVAKYLLKANKKPSVFQKAATNLLNLITKISPKTV